MEFLRDLLGGPISIGTVHHVLQSATEQAGVVNARKTCRAFEGLHDEIFQGVKPVLAGVCADRLTAISWLWRNIATPTPGACIYLTLPAGTET